LKMNKIFDKKKEKEEPIIETDEEMEKVLEELYEIEKKEKEKE